MRKFILCLAIGAFLTVGGCRSIYGTVWKGPKWVAGKVLNVYTGNGHYDGKARWDNFTKNYQQIWNFVDIYGFNYDIRDPFVDAPYFVDPR